MYYNSSTAIFASPKQTVLPYVVKTDHQRVQRLHHLAGELKGKTVLAIG